MEPWQFLLARLIALGYAPICEAKCGYDDDCIDQCTDEAMAIIHAYELSKN